MTMLHSCENRGHMAPSLFIHKETSMQCTFAPQVIGWYMSIYNQLFILVVELQLKFRERCGGGAKSSGDGNLWTKWKMV